jgi:hypothetical protein
MATELASVPDALKQCQRCQSLVLEWPTTPTLEPVDRKYIKDLGLQSSWSETCGTCQTFRTVINNVAIDESASVINNVAIDESAYLVPTLASFDFLISSPTTKEVKGWQVKGQKWVDKSQTIYNCHWTNGAVGTILEHPNSDLLSFVNIPNIRQWIDRCTKDPNHRDCNRPLSRPLRNLRVIDCQQRAIILQPEGAPYIALSYVWGKVAANPLEFNQAQAFGQDEISTGDGRVQDSDSHHPLPQLILDSMKVTLDLGYRYLWIDRYCINQSNSLEKHVQIEQMDLVYIGAAATIIAAEGQDPNDGLPGVSLPRQPTRSFKIGHTSYYVSSKLDHKFDKRKWGTRAWTYQEGELSSRRLVFLNDSVYLQCRNGILGVGFESPRAVPDSIHFSDYNVSDSDAAALNCIWEHISAYSSRSLSYTEDIVNAITGIFKFRSQISPGLYTFSGLPALEPDPTTCLSSLMWYNYNSPNTVNLSQRRQGYPSWSWLGITGSIISPNTRSMQKPEYYMCTKIQAILEDGTTTAPGASIRTSSKSGRCMLPIQGLVAHGVCIKDLQFRYQPSVKGQPSWGVQFLPGHKFPFDVVSIKFFPDLNDADMGTGKNFKALLLFFYDTDRAISPNKGYRAEPNRYQLQLLVLNQSTTKKTSISVWERVGAIWFYADVPEKYRTKEDVFRRLEQSECISREEIVLV